MDLDVARVAVEVAEQLLTDEFDQFDKLTGAAETDHGLIMEQVNNVDALLEMFTADHDHYLDLLLNKNKDIEFKAEKLKKVKFIKRRNAMNRKLKPTTIAAPVAQQASQSTYRVQLPQRNIPSFGGNVREWRSFWAAFQVVHGDPSIPTIEKLNYLRQYTVPGSKANKIVMDLPPAETSYDLAVKEMTHQFGREKTIIKTYIRDLLNLVMDNLEGKKNKNLIDVVSALQSHIWNLEQLGVTTDKFGTILYPIVECCIPREVLTRYLESVGAKEELTDFMEFLRKAVSAKEETRRAEEAFQDRDERRQKPKPFEEKWTPTAATFVNTENSPCGFCGMRNHKTDNCRNSQRMSYEEKKAALQKANCCFKCFGRDHHSRRCNAAVTCNNCSGMHHTMMCTGNQQTQRPRIGNVNISGEMRQSFSQEEIQQQPQILNQQQQMNPFMSQSNWQQYPMYIYPPQNQTQTRTDMTNYVQKPEVLLQTMYAKLHLEDGYKIVRLSMDSMSQSSYILKRTIEGCKLEAIGIEKVVHQTFGGKLSDEVQHDVVRIAVSGMGVYSHVFTFPVSIVETIAEKVIGTPDGPWYEECAQLGIPISDTKESADVDILIGNDYAPYLKVGMRSLLLQSGVIATETKLGWYIEGRIPGTQKKDPSAAVVCINMAISNLHISDYWSLDAIGIKDPYDAKKRSELEAATMEHFQSTVRRNDTGRYIVHLPWIEGHADLPDNRNIAFRVLEKATRDLERDGYLQSYHDVFKNWEELGIIEKVTSEGNKSKLLHYLGHRAVYKPGSTTPVRPVFNGSKRSRQHPSLNDCLEKGPNMLEQIPKKICKFRLNEIGVSADIAKAFLQLEVTEEHRDCLRFLWWKNCPETTEKSNNSVIEYRHCRVVFGVSSSPFLLNVVINDLLEKNVDEFPETVAQLKQSLYVDNVLASLPTLEDILKFKKESREIFSSAQMDLRGWEYGPSSSQETVSALGLMWNIGTDMLSFDIKNVMKKMELPITKRNVLAFANSIFDPLGWICPITITIKMIFKKICLEGKPTQWDDELPENYQKAVRAWKEQLPKLSEIHVPRYIGFSGDTREFWSLHVFCDASKDAYASCVFLRLDGNPVQVQLLAAKSRVTPSNILLIPRAELLSCLIASRLYTVICDDMELHDIPVTFWTDSTTALAWIQGSNSAWMTWLNNRVTEIRKLTHIDSWRHVPGKMNPADYPSRGMSVSKYMEINWIQGPNWLKSSPDTFPNGKPAADMIEVNKEKKKLVVSHANTNGQEVRYLDKLLALNDWDKIIKTVVYWRRFIVNKFVKKLLPSDQFGSVHVDVPTIEEITAAENKIFRYVQIQCRKDFPSDLKREADELQILRVKTKLTYGEDTANFKYPVLLHGKNKFVQLLIAKIHSLNCHAGIQVMLSVLRENYWITCCRRHVRSIIHICPVCRIHFAKRCRVVEAPLPINRITTTYCFYTTGVDLAGPLILRGGTKAYVVLYTCAVYRAVHLEVTTSLTTESFLETFIKFVARRGRPGVVYSDNGTNLTGSRNVLQDVDWEKVQEYAVVQKISWILNPPTAAWWGGWWERLIGMMKQILRRMLGNQSVSKHQLEILTIEAESAMNERALTYVTEDSDDLQPLKPSLFMKDLPVSHLPETEVSAKTLRKNFAHLQKLKEELRSRFRKEYLSNLVCHGKSNRITELRPGDIVMVEVDNKRCMEWPLGVVMEVFPSRDGHCRSARIRMNGGELVRPFQRLFLPEMDRVPPNDTRTEQEPQPDEIADQEFKPNEKEPNEIETQETPQQLPVQPTTPRRSTRKRTETKRYVQEL